MKCPICDNEKNNLTYLVKEMQQGFDESFEYIECSKCKCLFIKDIPNNIGKYYSINYEPHSHENSIIIQIKNKIYGMYLSDNKFIKIIKGDNVTITTKFWNKLLSKGNINKNSTILDVGCGDGKFLNILKKGGFKNLTGIDLFIDEENINQGINIIQSSLEDFKPRQKFDLIISNHSFEHMDNQLKNLKCFENLVKENGTIVIRIPVKSKPIWEKYGVNWFQIDAPRHFYLHTVKSFKILCEKTNLIIDEIIFDSYDTVLVNCEKYSKGIHTCDEEWDTFKLDDKTKNQLKDEIRTLNKNNEADQAIFVLKLKK